MAPSNTATNEIVLILWVEGVWHRTTPELYENYLQ